MLLHIAGLQEALRAALRLPLGVEIPLRDMELTTCPPAASVRQGGKVYRMLLVDESAVTVWNAFAPVLPLYRVLTGEETSVRLSRTLGQALQRLSGMSRAPTTLCRDGDVYTVHAYKTSRSVRLCDLLQLVDAVFGQELSAAGYKGLEVFG